MCGRFSAQLPPEFIARLFRTTGPLPNIAANANLAPTQAAMVVRLHPQSGERRLDVLTWGLVPHFTKDLKSCRRPFNARSETAATSPMFRDALTRRRCLIAADAFYEWKTLPTGKQPFAIAYRDGTPLALAGLWEGWRAPDGETLRTFTILTTTANADLSTLHERMPVIVPETDWPLWLGETEANPATLLRPLPNGLLTVTETSKALNRATAPESAKLL
jgi:putative SOS response-associated peptidase YedK